MSRQFFPTMGEPMQKTEAPIPRLPESGSTVKKLQKEAEDLLLDVMRRSAIIIKQP